MPAETVGKPERRNTETPPTFCLHGKRVLEIGCGEGGNLLPFALSGCKVVGVDIARTRIEQAKRFFYQAQAQGRFLYADIFQTDLKSEFDLVISHDCIEHVDDKEAFLRCIQKHLTTTGVAFVSFPAWHMPFGGHQQICKSRILSHLPFFHLLPTAAYRWLLEKCGEQAHCVQELLNIKRTKCPTALFERALKNTNLKILHKQLYFINPHYEVKFGLRPRKLWKWIAAIPPIRDYFTTSAFYLLAYRN